MLKLFALFSSLLVFLMDPVTCIGIKKPSLGDCIINFLSIYPCSEDPGFATSNLKNINDNGDKAMDLSINLREPFNEKYMFNAQIDIYENGQWKEDLYYHEGPLCEYILKYAPKAWAHLREEAVPQLESECYAEPGYYEITALELSADEIDFPTSIYAKMKVTAKIIDPDDELLSCKIVEVDVHPKSFV